MIEILDTHQHLMYKDRFRYDWTSSIPSLSSCDFPLEKYSLLAKEAGISQAIFMETAVNHPYYQEEAFLIKELINSNHLPCGVIAACFPEKDDEFDSWLEKTDHPQYVGYRRILHVEDDLLSESDTFIKNVRKIGRRNKVFDLCFLERQLPCAIKLAQKCEHTQLVLDHCGVPDLKTGNFNHWKNHLSQIARLPNVACKISGIMAYCPPEKEFKPTVKPYIEHCLEQFGWDRVVWGSDWPVINMTSNLPDWVTLSRHLVEQEDRENQAKLFHQNAQRIYRLKSSS